MQAIPNWQNVMSLFNYNREYVQLGTSQFIVSHPEPVRQAIEALRKQLDENPVLFTEEKEMEMMQRVREIAAEYFGVPNPDDIAMTDSTTMGLGTIYTALNLQKGQEILTTNHDHYSQHEAIRQATQRSGGSYKRIDLYQNLSEITTEEIVDAVIKNISEQTRVLGITWVHSSSGLKLPVPAISKALAKINAGRDDKNKVLMVLDGVHGFGIELETFRELGCDFFITGCHKWIYGPRGTGLVAATRAAWQHVNPVIPSFTDTMETIIAEEKRPEEMDGLQMTPGGFHALEHRWALYDAFKMHLGLGKQKIWERVHYLNRLCKEALKEMSHVKLHTPLADEFSAGIISFEVDGYSTPDAVEALLKKKIVATAAPYKTSWVRFTPGIINSEEEIQKGLDAVYSLKKN